MTAPTPLLRVVVLVSGRGSNLKAIAARADAGELPVRIGNLIAGGKNLGTTHITNGCYRLHPVEWNIGEAAGA